MILYGAFSWGLLAPQQRRLVAIAPQTAPVVLGLNTSCTYLGVTTAGVIGALGIPVFGAHHLGYLGASLVAVSLGVAELASWRIAASATPETSASSIPRSSPTPVPTLDTAGYATALQQLLDRNGLTETDVRTQLQQGLLRDKVQAAIGE